MILSPKISWSHPNHIYSILPLVLVPFQLLSALVMSGSLVLLEVLISVICREQKHVHEEQIQASLVKFITE